MQTIAILLIMSMGGHGVNIFDKTPYKKQVKRPNCVIDNNRFNSQTGKWEYGPYKYCINHK
jgi:hypothetical protein